MSITFRDCYASFLDGRLTIGNAAIEKQVLLVENHPMTCRVVNKKTGHIWQGAQGESAGVYLTCPAVDFGRASVSCDVRVTADTALSEPHLLAALTVCDGENRFCCEAEVYPELPFVSTSLYVEKGAGLSSPSGSGREPTRRSDGGEPTRRSDGGEPTRRTDGGSAYTCADEDVVEALSLPASHYKLEAIETYDKTDQFDHLVRRQEHRVYRSGPLTARGNLFVLHDYARGEKLLLIRNAPSHTSALNRRLPDLRMDGNRSLELGGSGIDFSRLPDGRVPYYGSTIGVGTGDIFVPYRALCRAVNPGRREKRLFVMANNWGDRNEDLALCEPFVKAEIDRAAELGVEIVQIDDGWERGLTRNTGVSNMSHPWEGYYSACDDYWAVNLYKFPNGLRPLADYARSRGVELAIWFSPDSIRDFANWERDVETVYGLYRDCGIRQFKIDGVNITSKLAEMNFVRFLDALTAKSGREITFNLDVTAQNRLGYVYRQQFGTLFVENRYTDWGNYYPHNTLKNLWSLASLFPTRRMQFELLNNRRNAEKYGDDPFAPALYGIDYLFATTMMANPLLWMEMSRLDPGDLAALGSLIDVYRQHSARLFDADVRPIGQFPDGMSFTGFQAVCSASDGYLLLFREKTEGAEASFTLSGLDGRRLKLTELAASVPGAAAPDPQLGPDGALRVRMGGVRSYAFFRYECV